MTSLRPVQSLDALSPSELGPLDLGPRPELRWVAPTDLHVDETYQRELGRRSYRLIRELCMNFSWRKLKPPIVCDVDGVLHCVDGQHTAIAAATRGVPEIPVFVIVAGSEQERADAFVGHNSDRIVMTPLEVYRAKLVAGDEDAVDTDTVCRRAGVTLRHPNPMNKPIVGETGAVGIIMSLVRRQGVMKARRVMEGLVKGGRGPISAAEIAAAEGFMCVVAPLMEPDEFARIVRALGGRGVLEARMQAAAMKRPHKHMLLDLYRQQWMKQKDAA